MRRFFLTLLSSPVLLGSALSLLTVLDPAFAAAPRGTTSDGLSCTRSQPSSHRFVCTRVQNVKGANTKEVVNLALIRRETPDVLEFTDEESDAAVILFGCDCPTCLNALRQLRGQPLLVR